LDQDQAEEALSLIRKVVDETRDDLVAQNWGLLWMLHAFVNLTAFVVVGVVVVPRDLPVWWQLVPMAAAGAIDGVLVLLLADRDRGIRSFVEAQMHGVWTTFIVATGLANLALHFGGADPDLFVLVVTLTSGIGFATMGVLFHARFFGVAAVFALALLTSPLLGAAVSWVVLGAVWGLTLFSSGLLMHRARSRRTGTARLL